MEDSKRGVIQFVKGTWRAVISELVSTTLLLTLGLASALPRHSAEPGGAWQAPSPESVALAFGFIVAGNTQVFGPASRAHMNPAMTLAALLGGHLSAARAAFYVAAQAAGAALGSALLLALAPRGATAATASPSANTTAPAPDTFGVTVPAEGVTAASAVVVEALLAGLLALFSLSVWDDQRRGVSDPSVPVKLGVLVAGLTLSGSFLTCASVNPARSLGPAIMQNSWRLHWVYWVGPMGGAALATLLHRAVLRAPPAPSASPLDPELAPELATLKGNRQLGSHLHSVY